MARPLALVTGVGRPIGIGAGIALKLADDGWDLLLSHWTPADEAIFGTGAATGLDYVVRDIGRRGGTVTVLPADLEQPTGVDALWSAASELGPVTALVLSHAWDRESGILDTSLEEFDRHFAINTRASWQLIAAFARQVPEAGGAIVALTSDAVVGNMPYGASKGALDRIVIAAAKELAGLGISSNALNPGPIDTGWMTDEVREHLTGMQPSRRLGTPADVAETVAFLVSPRGRWVTGQLLTSDGGFSIRG